MPVERIEQLTQRQRECLRLYQQRYRVKEIARALGISENTASGYLTEAATLLGVGGRQAAAQALAAFEAAHPEARGRFSVGDTPSAEPPQGPPNRSNSAPASTPAIDTPAPSWRARLPVRQGDGNDLSIAQRFIWLGLIVFGLVTGLGFFAIFMRTLGDVYARLRS